MTIIDSIYLTTQCPWCKETNEIEFQTKDGACGNYKYKVGDTFDLSKGIKKIMVIGDCRSYRCLVAASKQCLKNNGYVSGFGRVIYAQVVLNRGIVTDKICIDKEKSGNYDFEIKDWKSKLKGELLERFELVFLVLQNEDNAILLLHEFTFIRFTEQVLLLKKSGLNNDEIISIFNSNDGKEFREVLS